MQKTNFIFLIVCLSFLIFKFFAIYFTNLDLFGDEAQYWLWAQSLDFGYYSKPPLLSWTIYLFCYFFGNSFFSIKLISLLLYCLSSLGVYLLSKQLFKQKEVSLFIALSFFLMPAVSVSSFLVSTDVVLILFWTLSMFQILKIMETSRIVDFVLLGIFVGLAFLAKYAAVYFFICLVFLFVEKKFRKFFYYNYLGFFFSLLVFLAVISPNIIWNLNNDWSTFSHISDNAGLKRLEINFLGGIVFVSSQILMLGPVLFFFFLFSFFKYKINTFELRFLFYFSIPVLLVVLVESVLVRANANWAAPALVSLLISLTYLVYSISKRAAIINIVINLVFGFLFFLIIATSPDYGPFKRISGISNFAETLDKELKIEKIVVGDRLVFSNLSYLFRNHDVEIYTPYNPIKRKMHHFEISSPLPESFDENFIFIGYENEIKYLKNKYSISLIKKMNVSFKNDPIEIYEVVF